MNFRKNNFGRLLLFINNKLIFFVSRITYVPYILVRLNLQPLAKVSFATSPRNTFILQKAQSLLEPILKVPRLLNCLRSRQRNPPLPLFPDNSKSKEKESRAQRKLGPLDQKALYDAAHHWPPKAISSCKGAKSESQPRIVGDVERRERCANIATSP